MSAEIIARLRDGGAPKRIAAEFGVSVRWVQMLRAREQGLCKPRLAAQERECIRELHDAGLSNRQIAAEAGRHERTVRRVLAAAR